ncbi:MAG: carboxypeptidase regulatory-like domain-containing protein [Chromatiaceae bacterium]|nr:carboxypeptidase regulatory-like domain-containing protein [Chromatiaceae bacterium]
MRALIIFLAAFYTFSAVHADSVAPLSIRIVQLQEGGEPKPLNNVRVQLGARHTASDSAGVATLIGVPAGRYPLMIRQPGFDRLTQTVTVGPGARETVTLALTPSKRVRWEGRVLTSSEAVLAGARVELHPLDVKASLAGVAHSLSDWEGRYVFIDIPVGRYRLLAEAPGFAPYRREVEVSTEPAQAEMLFDPPLLDGVALDICREWGQQCGKPAADRFCQLHDFLGAAEFKTENDKPPTRIVNSGQLCEEPQCDRISWIRCQGKYTEQQLVRMQPLSQRVEQTVVVSDAVSGQPIADTALVLSETWPSGRIAEVRTDRQGRAVFSGVEIGDFNAMRSDGSVERSRRRVTLRAEAEGYVAQLVPLLLSAAAEPLALALTPLRAQPEVEPNDSFGQAQPVSTGAPVELRIAERGDHDHFSFRLTDAANLRLKLNSNRPLQTHLRLHGSDGGLIKERGAHAGQENLIEIGLLPGSYSVEVSEWGDNAVDAEALLTLVIDAQPAVDPNEPNQTPEAAAPVALNQQVSGLIWPQGDVDFYRIEVDRHGILNLRDKHETLQRHLLIHAADGTKLAEKGVYEKSPLWFELAVTPGVYYIEVREWGNNNASLEPYRVEVRLLPDDGLVEPPQQPGVMRAVRELDSHSWFATTLLPIGDRDLFSVNVPGAGVLRMQSYGPMQRHLQVYDADGKMLGEKGVYENSLLDFSWHVENPQTLFVSMREWGDNSYSLLPYSMSFWFERADEVDYQQRNEQFAQATPLRPGDRVLGSFLPLHDHDVYAIDVDFPGVLTIDSRSRQQTHIRLYDAGERLLQEKGVYENTPLSLSQEVLAGRHYLLISEWGDNSASTEPYDLRVELVRAEPAESEPLDRDALRVLREGEAQAFSFDHNRDRDRFLFEALQAGDYQLSVASPLQTEIWVYDDASGDKLAEARGYEPFRKTLMLKLTEPTRVRIELNEWGGNARSGEPGFVQIDRRGRPLHAAAIDATPRADEPERVAFSLRALAYTQSPSRCELDLDGDGRAEVTLSDDQPRFGRFAKPGLFPVESRCFGADGITSRRQFWVQATGQRARSGIELSLASPFEGEVIDHSVPLTAQAVSYSGRPVASVAFRLDGEIIASDFTSPFEAEINWQALKPGAHRIEVVARDLAGNSARESRNFRLSEYFALSPPDGAVLSGERIRVSWLAPEHGESQLRYRKQGDTDWRQAQGESGRLRVIELADLEPRVPYEIQPVGGGEPGPIRTLTRVKGLAFSQPRYGANVKRDYDQRVGIGVKNNGDQPLSVRLECGKPRDPNLLVSFVGEGSEDRPIPLAPGEYRQFHLAISAQDVDTSDHSVPIRIVADNGLSDEAEVAVHVRLPHVELEWQDMGALPLGHGRRLRLVNRGDTVTDLQVASSAANAVDISPTIQHGLLNQGASQEFIVSPRFYQGFTGVKSRIVARVLDKSFDFDYSMRLQQGEQVRRLWLFPGMDPNDPEAAAKEPGLIANAEHAAELDPAAIDWSQRDNPEDTDHDGRSDRWSMVINGVRWVGDDTGADNEVDFIHADVGDDGIFEYSAYREGESWRETNLVEAWLEMGFTLPWARSSYHPHNTDIVLNGRVIGSLSDVIPEGNFSFRIPPDALNFDDNGQPGENSIGINSKHLRGGHYVVNSDFRFKYRLTATPVWTVAKSEEEARAALAALNGVSVAAPDLSISTSELWLDAPLETREGDEVSVEIPVRNLGSVAVDRVPLVLVRFGRSGNREELARVIVDDIGLHGGSRARVSWKATPGDAEFTLVIDPDKELDDLDRANNKAHFFLQVKGEERPLKLGFNTPGVNARGAGLMVALDASVNQEAGPVEVELSIDGGLWNRLPPAREKIENLLLLQPGEHELKLRVTDTAGNSATESARVTIKGELPEARIVAPKAGETLTERHAHVVVEVPKATEMAGVRSAGGPWHRAVIAGDEAHADLPLRFGAQTIEAMVVDAQGAVRLLRVDVTASAQPRAGEERVAEGASEQGRLWPNEESDLSIDLFQAFSGLLQERKRPEPVAAGDVKQANTKAMEPKMRQRYEQARRLRAEGAKLQAEGHLQQAIERYQQSLRLYPDYRLEAHIRLVEQVL